MLNGNVSEIKISKVKKAPTCPSNIECSSERAIPVEEALLVE